MMFRMADTAAAAGNGGAVDQAAIDAAAKAKADAAAAASGPLDYKTLLVTLLDLDPATADDAAIKAAFDAEEAEPEDDIAALKTKAASADDLQTQLDDIQKKYAELNDQQTALYRQKQEADADEILKVYEGHFVDDASKAAIRNILLSDKEAGIAILNGLKKPEPATPSSATDTTTGAPPAPKHDPNADAAPTAEQKAADAETLIATIRKEGKFKDYTAAREEARRQKPELFS
jgi:hypothetical protein